MLALFPKVPEIQLPKALKIDVFDYPTDVFDYPTVVWRPVSSEPREYIRINLILPETGSLGYIVAADSIGLSSF